MSDDYEFSTDWFSRSIPAWTHWVKSLPRRESFLEIGSYEGRSACWLIENAIDDGGTLVCIDPWVGNGEHAPPGAPLDGQKARFERNVRIAVDRRRQRGGERVDVEPIAGSSFDVLTVLNCQQGADRVAFDFIYVDGSHLARDVIADLVLAWPLLRPGGLMVMDDYNWGNGHQPLMSPKLAIDFFTSVFAPEFEFVGMGTQVCVRKRGGPSNG